MTGDVQTLLRTCGRLSITAYRDGGIEIASLVTQTSVVIPTADFDMLVRELVQLRDERGPHLIDPNQGSLHL